MSTHQPHTANSSYAIGRLERALETAADHADLRTRDRAQAKVERWRAAIEGMVSGSLTVGSRTPVADTPAWVTLEVVHGGFATGRYLAEGELLEHERAWLAELSDAVPGETPRERLNNWFLGDEGQRVLAEAVDAGRLHIDVPEEAALPVIASLLARGCELEALELLEVLRPWMQRLRFYPQLRERPRPAGACVRRQTVGEVATQLRDKQPQPHVEVMNEALGVWSSLFDRLAVLWLDTVEGELPHLRHDGAGQLLRDPAHAQPIVAGGWPCRQWPVDWDLRREVWLAEYRAAAARHELCSKHRDARSNFGRLRAALELERTQLSGREVGSVRLALANTVNKLGPPGSQRRESLRRLQAEIATRPTHVELARVLATRLDRYPKDGGLASLEGLDEHVRDGEDPRVPAGTAVPSNLLAKLLRALEAPILELIERGVIGSSEVLAIVLPQITAEVAAAGIEDRGLRGLFSQIYAAFRRRRSLLLLDLQHQVRLDELPWVAALQPMRKTDLSVQTQARQTLEQVCLLAISAFPQTLLPNPLVRELGALATRAGLQIPLVEEVAADIFMGTFTAKWSKAASRTFEILAGTLYARYYDLPATSEQTAEGFTQLCHVRALEAQGSGDGSSVASNGAILEQSQILTTHNLAVLTQALELGAQLRMLAPELVARIFAWILEQQHRPLDKPYLVRRMIKNTAYAWRQAIVLLSLCDESEQRAAIEQLEWTLGHPRGLWADRFMPAVAGLRMVVEGGRFDATGRGQTLDGLPARRFLGWSVGRHWMREISVT
jgi:hypothetical protein